VLIPVIVCLAWIKHLPVAHEIVLIPVIVCLALIKHLLVASRGALGDLPGNLPKYLLGVPGSLERVR
jgi:hypothetical protein